MNQTEELARLQALKAQADKAKGEIVAAVQALNDKLTAAGAVTPEVEQALADLGASVQGLDDLNPDAAPPATPTA